MAAIDEERVELFRPEVLVYRREKSLSGAVISQSSAVKFMVWTSIGLMCFALFTLGLIRYKETESARGILEPKFPSQKLKSPVAAVVSTVYILEGEQVKKGQTLMKLSTLVLNGNGRSQQHREIEGLKLEKISLSQELIIGERLYKAEKARIYLNTKYLKETIARLRVEAKLLEQQEDLSSANLASLQRLLKQANVSQSQFDRERLNHLSIERERNAFESKIRESESETADGLLQLDLVALGFENKQEKINSEVLRVARAIENLGQETSISIQALQDGVVASLAVETGAPVSIGQTLMTILPGYQDLQATLFVPSSLIGKIHTEQELLLAFDSFPVSEFGFTSAAVTAISRAPLDPREVLLPVSGLSEPVFKVIAELDKHYVDGVETYPLISGIQFSADFVLENLSLLEFIFRPVLRLKGKVL